MKKILFSIGLSLFMVQSVFSYDPYQDIKDQTNQQINLESEIKRFIVSTLQTSEGKRLIQQAINSKDEVSCAVIRYLHTNEGKKLLKKLSSNDEIFSQKTVNTVKILALGSMGVLSFSLFQSGYLRNIIFCALFFKAFQII